ncbi:testis-expressed protein 11 isoform X1 [Parasteatoda tepidariorum]|uniref:testis-expressed protein 11 isoform X1 n=1 Tax=Parasteatoda tepidariorum TaxID=114398 RepID=UPI0039BC9642
MGKFVTVSDFSTVQELIKYFKYFEEIQNPLKDNLEYSCENLLENCAVNEDVHEWCQTMLSSEMNENISKGTLSKILELLFFLRLVKLDKFKEYNSEFDDAVISILNMGCKLINSCNEHGFSEKALFYNEKCNCLINLTMSDMETKEYFKNFLVEKKFILELFRIESNEKLNILNECIPALLRITQQISSYPLYLQYFLHLCYNVAIKCIKTERYAEILELLKGAKDLAKSTTKQIKVSLLYLLVVVHFHTEYEGKFQQCLETLNEIYSEEPTMLCVAWKVKVALLAGFDLKEILNNIENLPIISADFILYVTEQLCAQNYGYLISDALKRFRRNRFDVKEKSYLISTELKIYIDNSNLKEAFNVLGELSELARRSDTPTSCIYEVFKIILAHSSNENMKKYAREYVSIYDKCLIIMEVANMKMNSVHHNLKQRICFCSLEINDRQKAMKTINEIKKFPLKNFFDVFLFLQTGILYEDNSLVELALKNVGAFEDYKCFEDVLLACFTSARNKRHFVRRTVDVVSEVSSTLWKNNFSAKICRYFIRVYLNDSVHDHTKIQFLMEKALEAINREKEDDTWFFRISWSLALRQENEDLTTHKYFFLCSRFLQRDHQSDMKQQVLLMTISSGLEVIRSKESTHDIIGQVMGAIQECKTMEAISGTLWNLLFLYEFEIKTLLNDTPGLMQLLKKSCVDVETLQNAAATAFACNNKENLKVVMMALKVAANKEIPDSKMISQIYHSLIQVMFLIVECMDSSVELELFDLCGKICNQLENTLDGYTESEILWLTVKCWNYSIQKMTSGCRKSAREWALLSINFLSKLDTLRSLHGPKIQKLFDTFFS